MTSRQTELLQGTLDMLILKPLALGPRQLHYRILHSPALSCALLPPPPPFETIPHLRTYTQTD